MRSKIFLGAVLLLCTIPTLAQTSRGTVSGMVTDISGGVIPGATIELTNGSTGVVRSTVTNDAGIYRFDAVDLGTYDLKIAMPGFKVFLSTLLRVEANRTTTIDAKLEVGISETTVQINAETAELLVRDAPLRGGNFNPRAVSSLPLTGLNPISLARTLPGIAQPAGSVVFGIGGEGTQFSVNGQRPRGNNYLLDGTDNNDIAFTGTAQSFNIADAVQEISVQMSNFGAEFGRAGGGVFNVVTRSGTNNYHGTLLWQYRSQRFNSVSNIDKLNGSRKSVFSQNVYGFTLGGPIRQNRTFFFGAFQRDTLRATRHHSFVLPTAESVARLQALFPSNPRLDLYLNAMGDLRGSASSFPLALGVDPASGIDRGVVRFGFAPVGLPSMVDGLQWLYRLDHHLSDAHQLSLRHSYDSGAESPLVPTVQGVLSVYFPGYMADDNWRNQNFLVTDNYTISPTWTNEFRFSYGRTRYRFPISPRSVPLAKTLPRVNISNSIIATPGIPTFYPQFRFANNWLLQETQSKVMGRHAFRYGIEFLRQLTKQRGGEFDERGSLTYTDATNFSGFANFLDDFSGPSGVAKRSFGNPVYYPNVFRHSYFFQDAWKATSSLALTIGLRYENFGQPANALRFPAFAGFDPNQFLLPNKIKGANQNFGPAFGLAWSPSYKSGLLAKLFGDGKTVWRTGYQISYDTFFTQLVNFTAADTPNTVSTEIIAPSSGRGTARWSSALPTGTRPPSLLDAQNFAFDKNIRNPYTERWSFGLQRELANKILLDMSYVGSESHRLFTRADVNPRQPSGIRLHPNFGPRRIVASEGNSVYHAMQLRAEGRFAAGLTMTGSYTWSRAIDSTSEAAGFNINSGNSNLTSMPISQGGLKIDHGLSEYHRSQRLTIAYLWDIPGPKSGFWKHAFGGWSITGITTFQSGAPFSLQNGFDRNGDGLQNDRPDIGNLSAPLNTRAVVAPGCSTGYRNPDTDSCVTPTAVHFIEGQGLPNRSTVGRNTLLAGGINNWDMNLFKIFDITGIKKLEFRWEAFNIFNHPQFVSVPERNVKSSPPSRFLNRDFTNGGIRTMRVQVKFIF